MKTKPAAPKEPRASTVAHEQLSPILSSRAQLETNPKSATTPAAAPAQVPGFSGRTAPKPQLSDDTAEWLDFTPDETVYMLQMEDPGGEVVQDVPLTRQEYELLKTHLAATRRAAGLMPEGV